MALSEPFTGADCNMSLPPEGDIRTEVLESMPHDGLTAVEPLSGLTDNKPQCGLAVYHTFTAALQ